MREDRAAGHPFTMCIGVTPSEHARCAHTSCSSRSRGVVVSQPRLIAPGDTPT
ncbi:hypothetical protein DB32_008093 [Sandaracinus amylolyticus]|uniref:Uncharacterized protein n=1 Tax=Sandaracinus amylolyticus TaxID=927083 RepID=A0A0F6SHS3_9BACT|nr:hypothetical protein DB32_008093 [Sandaracinus amylolyticus]